MSVQLGLPFCRVERTHGMKGRHKGEDPIRIPLS